MNSISHFLLRTFGFENPDHPWVVSFLNWRRRIKKTDECMRSSYITSSVQPKLHLGASNHHLADWFNTDICPGSDTSLLDATRPYPFSSQTFVCVYAEHMIEHVTFVEGSNMLKECYRVMQTGGVIRLVTPDLERILALYEKHLNPIQQEYLEWMKRTFVPDAPTISAAFVINALFRFWGHQFLYDEATLKLSLETSGFKDVCRCRLDESNKSYLCGLSNSERYPKGLLEFESLCLEATKK